MIKTALLKLFSKEVIIKFLLDWFYAVSAGQWEAIKAKVKEAETKFTAPGTGAEKAAWVKAQIKAIYYGMRNASINYAIESAAALLNGAMNGK